MCSPPHPHPQPTWLLCYFHGVSSCVHWAGIRDVPPNVKYQELYRIHTAPLCSLLQHYPASQKFLIAYTCCFVCFSTMKWICACNELLITLSGAFTVWLVQVSLFSSLSVLTLRGFWLVSASDSNACAQVAFKTTRWIFFRCHSIRNKNKTIKALSLVENNPWLVIL